MNSTETWRPIQGHPAYDVSDHGRIRSSKRSAARMLNPFSVGKGYLAVTLVTDGGRHRRYVHQLVAEAFHGARPADAEVRHLDGNPNNNQADNLAYGSRSDNAQDRIRHGRDQNARKTHCKNNHPFDEANTYRAPGSRARVCRICAAAKAHEYIVQRDALHGAVA